VHSSSYGGKLLGGRPLMSYAISIIYNQTVDSAFMSSLAKPTSIVIYTIAEKQALLNPATMEWLPSQKQHYPNGKSITIFWIKIEECLQSAPWLGSLFAASMNVHWIPQAPRISTQRREKWKVVVKLEYFLNLADSAEFASLLALLEEVDTLEWLKRVKSQSSGKPCLQWMKDMPSGLLPSSQYIPTRS